MIRWAMVTSILGMAAVMPPPASGAVPATPAGSACTKYAAPSGSDSAAGTLAAPYATAQKLVNSLSSGQIGCLRAGTYAHDLTISHAGITLTAYKGEQATVLGRLWIKAAANGVTVTGLTLDGKNGQLLPSPTVNGNDDRFILNDVTNEHTEICFVIGSSWGRAERTIIQRNRIHDCGKLPSTNQDHGIYIEAADYTQVIDNVIYRNVDRGIQLYPDAQYSLIRGNVIDGNGEGVIFSGANGIASNNNVVENNLLTNSTIRSDVESWYPSGNPKGVGNAVHDNCLVRGAQVAINTANGGFTAYSNLIVADAGYVNRSAGDFRLLSTSPCRSYVSSSTAPAGLDWSPLNGSTATTTSTTSGSATTTSSTPGSASTGSASTTTSSPTTADPAYGDGSTAGTPYIAAPAGSTGAPYRRDRRYDGCHRHRHRRRARSGPYRHWRYSRCTPTRHTRRR